MTRSVGRMNITQTTTGDLEEEEEEGEEEEQLVHGRRKRKVAFMPSLGESISLFTRSSPTAGTVDSVHE